MTVEFWIASGVAIAEACAGVAICVMWHFDARQAEGRIAELKAEVKRLDEVDRLRAIQDFDAVHENFAAHARIAELEAQMQGLRR